jgi:cell division protein FtsL
VGAGRLALPPAPRRTVVLVMLGALIVVSALAISHVWTRLKAIEYGYKISKANKQRAELVETNRRLRIEVALLKSPERIARIATEELGLQHPLPDQIRRLWPRGMRPPERVARAGAEAAAPGGELSAEQDER